MQKIKRFKKVGNKEYQARRVKELEAEYNEKMSLASEADKPALKEYYENEITKAKKLKLVNQIQMIFQDPIASLNPRMTVKEIISEGLVIQGVTDKEYIDKKVYEMLDVVGLVAEHANRYPHEFSGGQRQRIGIARSIIMNPAMIIADEPISALDVSIRAQIINLLNDLRESMGLTIMFIAHDLSVVKYFSDRIGVMYYGHMVELASSDELFAHPMHPYTRSLLSAIPLPDPLTEKERVRITYNPLEDHDYSTDQPTFREIIPGHFVSCNDAEEAKYREEFNL
ncbi:MAG: ATP-binding cassette domain-containing protein [Erysipelotrichaceae bacterium]|nr:ATP-binding cassette domain-containing protein [Erysipelotrichaceae bacterium]